LKIVMVADQYPPVVGGAERQAQKLSRALAARGNEVVVLTGRWERSMRPVDHEGGVVDRALPSKVQRVDEQIDAVLLRLVWLAAELILAGVLYFGVRVSGTDAPGGRAHRASP
jgi:hypothetical protein